MMAKIAVYNQNKSFYKLAFKSQIVLSNEDATSKGNKRQFSETRSPRFHRE